MEASVIECQAQSSGNFVKCKRIAHVQGKRQIRLWREQKPMNYAHLLVRTFPIFTSHLELQHSISSCFQFMLHPDHTSSCGTHHYELLRSGVPTWDEDARHRDLGRNLARTRIKGIDHGVSKGREPCCAGDVKHRDGDGIGERSRDM